ncbi:hypothetical protein A3L04_04985 [Thermococcus chitonophagus]|uniref:Condensin complex subunit 1 C-terminal domain-containing protein n=1 Tax=Thermococcus chitonophagus TaxID=54262 RepID=A0A160VU63_9EURY|nr:HEAT repeat domain-containing protein [Thermococcus chitonophagus]ASJ16474.1 hypothetical protein A3L04_04985 [Thermococcus chitonophagus]CUX78530.1 hypothetical protein CHITON_1751 [Thermococcus chitonophagus]
MSAYEEFLEYLKGWRLRKAIDFISANKEEGVDLLIKGLKEKDPIVKKGCLYIIKKLVMKGHFDVEDVRRIIPEIIELLGDRDESVVLQAVETLNTILTFIELPPDLSSEISEILMKAVEEKPEPINEYAAEGLAALGAKIVSIARRIFEWIRGIIKGKSSRKKIASLRVLKEIIARTENPEIMEEAFNLALDLLNDEDPVVRKSALSIIEVAVDRAEYLSRESLERASKELGSSNLGTMAREAKAKIDDYLEHPPKEKSRVGKELEEYTVEVIKKMFEREQHAAVLELAKSDYKVLQLVIRVFLSEDLLTKLDALWVLSNAANYIKRDDAEKIIPQLTEFLLHDNPWIRSTSAKVLAELALTYSSIMDRAIKIALDLLERGEYKYVRGGIELASALLNRVENLGFLEEVAKRIVKLEELPREVIEFLKEHEKEIEELDPELKKKISIKLANSLLS